MPQSYRAVFCIITGASCDRGDPSDRVARKALSARRVRDINHTLLLNCFQRRAVVTLLLPSIQVSATTNSTNRTAIPKTESSTNPSYMA